MRRIVIAVMGTISALVLVFSFDASRREHVAVATDRPAPTATGEEDTAQADDGSGGQDGGQDDATSESQGGQGDDGQSDGSGQQAAVSGTFTGDEVQTRWGIVQVRIVVKSGRIVSAKTLKYPNENHRDEEINSWAVPQLEQATVDSNGKQVDSLSGATVTSDGYRQSLQSALDQAHL